MTFFQFFTLAWFRWVYTPFPKVAESPLSVQGLRRRGVHLPQAQLTLEKAFLLCWTFLPTRREVSDWHV